MRARAGTVSRLLGRAFAALVVLIILSGTAGIVAAVLQHRWLVQISETILPLRAAGAELRAVLADAQRSVRGYALTGDEHLAADYLSASARFGPTVLRLRALATTQRELSAVDEQVRLAARWWRYIDARREVEPGSAAAAHAVEAGGGLFEPIMASSAAFDAELAARHADVRRRSDLIWIGTLVWLVTLTAIAALLATVTAVRATGLITRPLGRLVTVLDRLGRGDHAARAPTDMAPAEIGAVARAVNGLADEADRVRGQTAEAARLSDVARALGARVQRHLSVGAVLEEAVGGLGQALDADHVVVRLVSEEGYLNDSRVWSRPPDADAGAPGAPEPLAGLSPKWLVASGAQRACVWNDLADAGDRIPGEELAALRTAAATAVLAVAFPAGAGPGGALTLIRCAPGAAWSVGQARAVEAVASDLARGLLHAQLYEREQELVARLRDLDTAKTDFMSTVSHELRTPLTSIAGYLEMLSDGDAGRLTEAQERMLDVIARNTTRLRSLIEDLLVLSRIESGTLRTSRQPVEFGWLITSAVAAIAPTAAAAGVNIETDVGAALAGHADAEQIDRVLMNLLTNAVKFTPRGGRVQVCAARDGDDVLIQVIDNGVGVPAAEQRNLFNRFFRASNAVERAIPGTGLGLAIVRTIVANHGGQVAMRSREGEGTTVTVRLPS